MYNIASKSMHDNYERETAVTQQLHTGLGRPKTFSSRRLTVCHHYSIDVEGLSM